MSTLILDLLAKAAAPKSFADEPVDRETIRALLMAARVAPSADNMQIWRFVIAESETVRAGMLASLTGQKERRLFSGAPLLVACLGAPWVIRAAKKEQPFYMIDVPIAVCHLRLAAAEFGLAAAFCQDIEGSKLLAATGADDGKHQPVGLLALGKPGR